MSTDRTNFRSLVSLIYESAVSAFPPERSLILESLTGTEMFKKFVVPFLVQGLNQTIFGKNHLNLFLHPQLF